MVTFSARIHRLMNTELIYYIDYLTDLFACFCMMQVLMESVTELMILDTVFLSEAESF